MGSVKNDENDCYDGSFFGYTDNVAPEQYNEDFEVKHKELCKGVSRYDVVKELNKIPGAYPKQQAQRIASCGEKYYLHQCTKCDTPHVSGHRCESKICPECGAKRIFKLIELNKDKLDSLDKNPHAKLRPIHLVLTFRNVPVEVWRTKKYQDHIYSSSQKFFRNKYVRKFIKGAIVSLEQKRPPAGYVSDRPGRDIYPVSPERLVNCHVHAFCEAKYIPHKAGKSRIFQRIWKRITGDSYIVFIKQSRNLYSSLHEVVKYVLSPGNLGDAKTYAEYVRLTQSRKSYSTYGTFRGSFKLSEKLPEHIYKKCEFCEAPLRYVGKIGKTEALRYWHLANGPPIDAFGHFTDLGFPRTLSTLKNTNPFPMEKIKVGGFNEKWQRGI